MKNILISFIVLVGIISLVTYGVMTSDFSNIKKYDGDSPREDMKSKIAKERYYSTRVRMQGDDLINLGDFEISLPDNRILAANISIKYIQGKSFFSKGDIKKEVKTKNTVLRNAIIEEVMNQDAMSITNHLVKKRIIQSLNNYLTKTQITDIYFNEFLIQ